MTREQRLRRERQKAALAAALAAIPAVKIVIPTGKTLFPLLPDQ